MVSGCQSLRRGLVVVRTWENIRVGRGIEDQMREVVTILVLMFARKGEIHQGLGWKIDKY